MIGELRELLGLDDLRLDYMVTIGDGSTVGCD